MWKSDNSGKKTVELAPGAPARPARRSIRRDPIQPYVAPDERRGLFTNIDFKSREWEIGLGIAGILLFALAINAVLFGVSATMVK